MSLGTAKHWRILPEYLGICLSCEPYLMHRFHLHRWIMRGLCLGLLWLGTATLPGYAPEAMAQLRPKSEEPGYSEAEKAALARRRANQADPNMVAGRGRGRGGEKMSFWERFKRWFKRKPNTESANYEGEAPARRPGDKFWNSNEPNYSGDDPPPPGANRDILRAQRRFSPTRSNPPAEGRTVEALDRFRGEGRSETQNAPETNNGNLGYAGDDPPPAGANRDILRAQRRYSPSRSNPPANGRVVEALGRYRGDQRAPSANAPETNNGNLGFSGNDAPAPGANRDILRAQRRYSPTRSNPPANGRVVEALDRYRGDERGQRPDDKFDRPVPDNYSGEGIAVDPKTRGRINNGNIGYSGNQAPAPGANRDILRAIDKYSPSRPYEVANSNILQAIDQYRGNLPAVDPEKRWRWNIAGLLYSGNLPARDPEDKFDTPYPQNYSGEMRAVDPEKRWRNRNGWEGWRGDYYIDPPFNKDVMQAIEDYAPTRPTGQANSNILQAIDQYRGYDRIRTERAQARYYRKVVQQSADYMGEYPQRIRGRLSWDGHPTQVHLVGKSQPSRERNDMLRGFNKWWNRLFVQNIQPNVFKKRQRRPRYDRGEAEWWNQLDQPSSVDPAEGGESDSGDTGSITPDTGGGL